MAIPLLKHSYISRKRDAPGTAAAHARYVMRSSATVLEYSERMPIQYHAVQRFMLEREQSIRKDGRVCDKFIIAVPREMQQQEAFEVVQKFGQRLTEGRASFLFTLQDWGTDNPHVHFVLVDADVQTGRRVVKTTDRDSTERIKAIWEDTANSELARLGYEERISFAEVEAKAARLREKQAEAGIPTTEIEPPRPELPLEPEPVEATIRQEADMADRNSITLAPAEQAAYNNPHPDELSTLSAEELASAVITRDLVQGELPLLPHQRVQKALEYDLERSHLQSVHARLESYLHSAQAATERAELSGQKAMDNRKAFFAYRDQALRAGDELEGFGDKRGFQINLGRLSLRTPRRIEVERLERLKESAEFQRDIANRNYEEAEYAARADISKGEEDLTSYRDLNASAAAELQALYGDGATLNTAQTILANSTHHELEGVSAQEVYADYEVGNLTYEEAKRACELLDAPEMIWAIEQRHRLEQEQEGGYEM